MDYFDRDLRQDAAALPQGGAARLLAAAAIAVAAFSFMLTTVVWRLVHQTGAVEAAVRDSVADMQRAGVAHVAEVAGLREDFARQSGLAGRLEEKLARVEATALASLDRMHALSGELARQAVVTDQVRQEMARATAAIAQGRTEILERMAVHADRQASVRDGLVRDVTAAIGQMERSLVAQVEDFQRQKHQIDAAAERDRATRRALLNETMQAFTVQVEGLRQILDGLRIEAEAVDERPVTAEAAPTERGTSAAADVSHTPDGEQRDAAPTERPEQPATAARETGTAIE
jgi:hypothetical protein